MFDSGPQESDADLVDFVEKEFKRREDERRSLELQWRLNVAFVEGNQYLEINSAGGDLGNVPEMYPVARKGSF